MFEVLSGHVKTASLFFWSNSIGATPLPLRSVFPPKKVKLKSNSPFVGAELAIKAGMNGYKVGEIGIHTYPRTFGTGSSVSFKNIVLTLKDMLLLFIRI